MKPYRIKSDNIVYAQSGTELLRVDTAGGTRIAGSGIKWDRDSSGEQMNRKVSIKHMNFGESEYDERCGECVIVQKGKNHES